MKAILRRFKYRDEQVEGNLRLHNDGGRVVFSCLTLELAWKDNAPFVSCIPTGSYRAIPRVSAKYGKHYYILQPNGSEIPERTFILIHVGNFKSDIEGCILVGQAHTDINADGYVDVTASRATLSRLLEIAPDGFEFEIVGEE